MLETSTDASYGPMYTFDIGGTSLSDAEDLEFYILIKKRQRLVAECGYKLRNNEVYGNGGLRTAAAARG